MGSIQSKYNVYIYAHECVYIYIYIHACIRMYRNTCYSACEKQMENCGIDLENIYERHTTHMSNAEKYMKAENDIGNRHNTSEMLGMP